MAISVRMQPVGHEVHTNLVAASEESTYLRNATTGSHRKTETDVTDMTEVGGVVRGCAVGVREGRGFAQALGSLNKKAGCSSRCAPWGLACLLAPCRNQSTCTIDNGAHTARAAAATAATCSEAR